MDVIYVLLNTSLLKIQILSLHSYVPPVFKGYHISLILLWPSQKSRIYILFFAYVTKNIYQSLKLPYFSTLMHC